MAGLPRKTYEPGATGTLAGVRVLDLSRLVAGNMLTQFLADTVHHVWENLEGDEVCLAILFEEHARLNYGADGDMLAEEMKDILCEMFGLDKDEMDARNEEAGRMSEQAA